jgi:hypothetical protein
VKTDSPRDQQLANIRRIYGPEKEALGVLASKISLVRPAEPDVPNVWSEEGHPWRCGYAH